MSSNISASSLLKTFTTRVCRQGSSGDVPESSDLPPPKKAKVETSVSAMSKPVLSYTPGIINIVAQGNEGFANSVTHYYHFLLAVIIPLIEYHLSHQKQVNGYNICTDIGPMKRLLTELPINILEFAGPSNTKARNDPSLRAHGFLRDNVVILPAYDSFTDVLYDVSEKFKLTVLSNIKAFLNNSIPRYILQTKQFDIILIERTDSEQYFRQVEVSEKNKHSGASLRKLQNHSELADALLKKYGSLRFANIELERSSIYYQYWLFKNAKLVVAQHGAALTNIIFMDSSASVIEINPPANCAEGFRSSARKHFVNLSTYIGMTNYATVVQDHDHSAVNIGKILELAEKFVPV